MTIRTRGALALGAGFVTTIFLAAPAHAQRTAQINYTCDLGGVPAQLTAQVQAVTSAGVFIDPSGLFAGSISTGDVNYFYQGTVTSATGRYSFTGTNQFADFVDLLTNDRFRVQLIIRGRQLLMIINPQGPGPTQHLCQQSGDYPQQAGGRGGLGQPAPGAAGRGASLDQLMQSERQDFGIQPSRQLHNGEMHGPTPASIPGGQVITTRGLVELVQGQRVPFILFDTLGGPESLPSAISAAWASQPGSFTDQVQRQLVQTLQQATQGRKDVPLIFYCLSTQCWMSYNASLRAINAGYTNVLWYRGGIEAWKQAGLPTQPTQ